MKTSDEVEEELTNLQKVKDLFQFCLCHPKHSKIIILDVKQLLYKWYSPLLDGT